MKATLLAILLGLSGCATAPAPLPAHHLAAESWDQENLKVNDSGCPTSIYSAPGGELQMCGAIHAYKAADCWVDDLCTYTVRE